MRRGAAQALLEQNAEASDARQRNVELEEQLAEVTDSAAKQGSLLQKACPPSSACLYLSEQIIPMAFLLAACPLAAKRN